MTGETPAQTIGPFFAVLPTLGSNELVAPSAAGAIELRGLIFDGAGSPVADALVELWQANEWGRYAHPEDDRELPLREGFTGYGRCPTDEDGAFRFVTILPGAIPFDNERHQAPHLNLCISARGLLRALQTRVYFPGETVNGDDPLLASLSPDVSATLIANQDGPASFRFDIRLQGEGETAFLAF